MLKVLRQKAEVYLRLLYVRTCFWVSQLQSPSSVISYTKSKKIVNYIFLFVYHSYWSLKRVTVTNSNLMQYKAAAFNKFVDSLVSFFDITIVLMMVVWPFKIRSHFEITEADGGVLTGRQGMKSASIGPYHLLWKEVEAPVIREFLTCDWWYSRSDVEEKIEEFFLYLSFFGQTNQLFCCKPHSSPSTLFHWGQHTKTN